jgi:Zn-dependent protease
LDFTGSIYSASTWIIPVLIAITFHEAAHAYAAWKLGDDTAYCLGRVTFNPLKHVDLFGTILFPALLFLTMALFLFGWAKPVPVAFGRLSHPRCGMAIVAIAGPLTNMLLALASAALLRIVWLLPETIAPWLVQTLYQSILLNLILAIFNMLPLLRLDGGRVVLSVLPNALARLFAKLERFGFLGSAWDHLSSADARQISGNRLEHLPMVCRDSACLADANFPANCRSIVVTVRWLKDWSCGLESGTPFKHT